MTTRTAATPLASVRAVTVAFCAAFVALAALQGWLYYRMADREGADRRQEQSQQVQLGLEALLADVQRAGTAARHFAATGVEKERTSYAAAAAVVPAHLADIRAAAAADPAATAD
ncbi:MAG: hypothetical protein JWO31_4143, partial [Phycisphaerales bacterium]|nr:hypothetical protein [Phycisphaerales bacterium]